MIEISGAEFQHVSARNAISCIDYIIQKRGQKALADLFNNILHSDSLVSNKYCYHNKPLDLSFFQNIDNWYSNDINIQIFHNVKEMGIDTFELGFHSIMQAARTKNFAVSGMMKALGPLKMTERISSINSLYNKTKTVNASIFEKDYVIINIKYQKGFKHTAEITRQNLGAYVASVTLVGKRNIQFEILDDIYSANAGFTQLKISWKTESLWLRLRWFFGKQLAHLVAKTYLKSHDVVQEFHSELVNSLQEEISKKEIAFKKNNEYLQIMLKAEQEQSKLLEAEVRRKTIHLRQALEDKQQLFNDFSHEVRTPLMLAINPLKRLQEFTNEPKYQSLLATAQTNLEDLNVMFKQLYCLEKIKQTPSEIGVFEVLSVTNRVIESVQYLADELSIFISVNIPAQLCFRVQVNTVELILKNLLENALKYCGVGDNILITAKALENGRIFLAVEDSGPGIPIDHREKVFQRFHRVPGVENIRGSGIGLAIVKQWVETNHGSITCTESNLGGAKFNIFLPQGYIKECISVQQDAENLSEDFQTTHRKFKNNLPNKNITSNLKPRITLKGKKEEKPTLLLVEDNFQLRAYLAELFSKKFECIQAEDGEQGWKIVLSQNPDLVVSDVMMPKLDGYELTKRLKKNLETCHIPIILLTAKGDSESKLLGLKVEADDYLAKPIEDDVLLQKVTNVIAQQTRVLCHIRSNLEKGVPVDEYLNLEHDKWKKQLDAYLERRFADENLTIGDIAKELAMSERKLQMIFKKSIGITPVAYRKLFRLNKAREMIKQNSQTSLTNIAIDCGFGSLQSFSKEYKKQFGVNPCKESLEK